MYNSIRINVRASLLTVMLFLFSCNTGSGRQQNATMAADTLAVVPAYDASLAKGKVTDSVACRKDNKQTYSLYLPSGYTAARAYPCVYLFDAHARGTLPVAAYKAIAERYGFVLVASNNCQNGVTWPVTNGWISTLMEDTRMRINIDPRRIYTAGFSGGSRVASSVAILDGGVAGVIGCAAGFPQLEQPIQNRFDYFGIVGDYDFNYSEMEQLDKMLEQSGFSHQLLTSGGIHGWPSAGDFETALLWQQVNGMKRQLQPKNDTLLSAIEADFNKRIAMAISGKDWLAAHDLAAGAVRLLNGMRDISLYNKRLTDINKNAGYKNAAAMQAKMEQDETQLQRELQQQFAIQGEKWWAEKIKQLDQNAQHAKTPQEAQMNKRVLNYMGFLGYMYTDHALKSGDMVHAASFLSVFKLADPHNADCGYLGAVYYMQKGAKADAIASLNEAAALGYNELAKLLNDPAFSSIAADEGFKMVVEKVQENLAGKR